MNAERFEIHIGQLRLDAAWAGRQDEVAAALSHELARRLGAASAEPQVAPDTATAGCVAGIAAAVVARIAGRLGAAVAPTETGSQPMPGAAPGAGTAGST